MRATSVDRLPAVVGVLIVTALMAGVGVVVLDGMAESQYSNTTATNDTVTCYAFNTSIDLGNSATNTTNFIRIENSTMEDVTNSTDPSMSFVGNFTLNPATGQITCEDNVGTNTSLGAYNFTYVYTSNTNSGDVFVTGQAAPEELASWLDVIAIVIAAGVILALVLGVLMSIRS